MEKKFKYISKFLLFFYFITGLYLSVNTGITTDELPNLYIWSLNLEAIKNFLGFNDTGYQNLYNYEWKYKGVGFYYFSYIYLFLANSFISLDSYSKVISDVLINHSLIFITFFLSALISRKIVYLIRNNSHNSKSNESL